MFQCKTDMARIYEDLITFSLIPKHKLGKLQRRTKYRDIIVLLNVVRILKDKILTDLCWNKLKLFNFSQNPTTKRSPTNPPRPFQMKRNSVSKWWFYKRWTTGWWTPATTTNTLTALVVLEFYNTMNNTKGQYHRSYWSGENGISVFRFLLSILCKVTEHFRYSSNMKDTFQNEFTTAMKMLSQNGTDQKIFLKSPWVSTLY